MTGVYKPQPVHNPLLAPSICCCTERCARIVLDLRCPVTDQTGHQCGDYRGHRGHHTLLVCTTFDIAAERLRDAAP